jgi:hypothetical protein
MFLEIRKGFYFRSKNVSNQGQLATVLCYRRHLYGDQKVQK